MITGSENRVKPNIPTNSAKACLVIWSNVCRNQLVCANDTILKHPLAIAKWKSESCQMSKGKIVRFILKSSFIFERRNRDAFLRCIETLSSGKVLVGESSNPRLLLYEKNG